MLNFEQISQRTNHEKLENENKEYKKYGIKHKWKLDHGCLKKKKKRAQVNSIILHHQELKDKVQNCQRERIAKIKARNRIKETSKRKKSVKMSGLLNR